MKNSILNDMNKKDRIDFYISIPIILAALAFIVYYSFSKTETMPQAAEEMVSTPLTENTMDIESITLEENVYIPYAVKKSRKKKNIVYKSAHQNISSDSIKTEEKTKLTTQQSPIADTLAVKEKSIIKSDSLTAMEAMESSTFNAAVSESKSDNNAKEATSQTISPSSTTNKDCIIVIGAYNRKSNIYKLTKRLQNEAYEVFTTPHKGMTRVGIYHSCEENLLTQTLKEIRKSYAKDAMVLEVD